MDAARCPIASRRGGPSATSAGVAIVLHAAVCAIALSAIRLPETPRLAGGETVDLVFAPETPAASPATAVPVTAPDMPEPTPAPEVAKPVEAPAPTVPQPHEADAAKEDLATAAPAPEAQAPAAAAEVRPVDRPKPIVPPVARKAHAKPPAWMPIAQTQGAKGSPAADAPPNQAPARPVAAEAAIPSEWQRSLAAWLVAHKTYPEEARRAGTEGNVVLRFTVDRSGRVLDVVLVRSAGSSILDTAAEALVRNARLPPFTDGMSQDRATLTVQMHYALRD